jgi:hypothetical protein
VIHRLRNIALTCVFGSVAAAAQAASPTPTPTPTPSPIPSASHVFLIVEENQSYSTVTNAADPNNYMPWLIGEGNAFGHASNYVTDSSGSLLDYLWLSSGSCHGDPTMTDCILPPGTHSFGCTGGSCVSPITDDNIFREMIALGMPWKLYAESIPSAGYMGASVFPYDTHHNAAIWYSDVINSTAQQNNIVPFTQFVSDLNNNQLPRYSIIIPDDTHDAHDATPAAADTWLQANIAPLLQQPFFQPCGDALLIITFDNGDGDGAGQVYTAVIGPKVKLGSVSSVAYRHENSLRTILDALGITTRPGAAATVNGMADFFIAPAPCPVLTPSPVSFSSQILRISAATTVSLANGGDADMAVTSIAAGGDFSQTNNCGSTVPARKACTVTVTFKPTAAGPRSGILTLEDSASGSPHTVNLSGTGVLLGLTSSSLTFANQVLNTTSAAQSLTITNTGSTDLSITNIAASQRFSETDNCTALAPGGTCTVNISFAPSVAGSQSGSITVSYGGTTSSINVSGTGVPLGISSPTLTFPNQLINTASAAQGLTITNTGGSNLTINKVTATQGFSESDNCGTLAPTLSCTIQVSFMPAAAGPQSGTITVAYGGTQSGIAASGTGVLLGLSATSVGFGVQVVNTTSATKSLTITNTGSSRITITGVTAPAPFNATNNCSSLAPNDSCSADIAFDPTSTGPLSGFLAVQYGGTQTSVNLNGIGTDFSVAPQSGATGSLTIMAGQTATFNLSVSGSPLFVGTVNLSCNGAPAQASCALSAPSLMVDGPTPANFTAGINTTRRSSTWPSGRYPQLPPVVLVLALILGLLSALAAARRKVRYASALALGSALVFLASCGGGGGGGSGGGGTTGTPAGTYTIIVTATSGSANRSFNLTLNVD